MFQVNEYFEGKVASIAHHGAEGKATLGVIAPGEYEFGTSSIEIMTVISGEMTVQREGDSNWYTFGKFESFRVEKDTKFKVRTNKDTPYQCLYL